MRCALLVDAYGCTYKIQIFGYRVLENARSHGLVPDEIFSERNRTADDETLAKVLFLDTVRQTRLSAGLALVDAANCYDSVAHAIASLVFQAFGVPEEAVQSMLSTIEEMKYFLRTAYGDSKNFRGHKRSVNFKDPAKEMELHQLSAQ